MKDAAPVRVRFGGFELDLRAGELREGVRKVLLQEQPFQILLMLVEHSGEIVTREDIQRKFWPNDTVVDFDHGINTAIRKLRKALGDSPEEPKYIETLARRGYRFLVPVEAEEGVPSLHSASAEEHTPTSLVGRKVSHYRVLEIIGGGGMGVVYRAEDLKLGRQVALKFLPEELAWDPAALKRFEREARAASSLDHPNICTIYEVEEHEDQPFLVMQLLDGKTLRDRMAADTENEKTFPLEEFLHVAIGVAQGLQAAHEKGVIHRDIKPANIFLTTAGQIKILDFGIAKLVDSAKDYGSDKLRLGVDGAVLPGSSRSSDTPITRFGATMGTAGYMSPEQVRGEKLDARTDIFSFGLVLYEMATGKRAFSGETAEIVHHAVVHQQHVPVHDLNPELPLKLERIIDKALEKDRARRYQSALEVREALSHVWHEKERGSFGRRGTKVHEAYLLHVKAMYWADKWTPDALQKAFRYTQQAIEADPAYAEAYGDLAYLFALMGYHGSAPMDMFPRARAAAEKSLELDDRVAKAHAALGFTQLVFDWDFAAAELEILRAIDLDPKFSGGNYVYSQWCLSQGWFEEAIYAAKRALEIDPLALPLSFNLGAVYLYARRYVDAIEQLRKLRDLDPSFSETNSLLALAYARNGMCKEAMAAAGVPTNETTNRIRLGIVSAILGKDDVARDILDELRGHAEASPALSYRVAGIHAQLGDLDEAFEFLEQALVGRAGQMVFVGADPGFDNLHGDQRWVDLLRRVGLAEH